MTLKTEIEEIRRQKSAVLSKIAAAKQRKLESYIPLIRRSMRVLVYGDKFNTDTQNKWLGEEFVESFRWTFSPCVQVIDKINEDVVRGNDILVMDYGGLDGDGGTESIPITRALCRVRELYPDLLVVFATTFSHMLYSDLIRGENLESSEENVVIQKTVGWQEKVKAWIDPE
jgi:hypothetical protein